MTRAGRARAGVLLLAAALAGCGGEEAQAAAPRARNAVVCLVDTLRADRLGAYGGAGGLTPHLDAFAREALVFERCIAQSTWTKPAVASLFSGLHPHRHGALSGHSVLPGSLETLAEVLRDAGLDTAAFGANPHVFGQGQGFDQGFGVFEAVEPPPGEAFPPGELIVDAALGWLDARRPGPFFLYVHLIDPHFPYGAPGFAGAVETDMDAAEGLGPAERGALEAAYDAEVRYADAQFGRILAGLAERGLLEDTLIVLLSDHGEEFFEHGGLAHHAGKMFEEVARVPLLLKVPGLPASARGRRCPDVVEQIDVRATLVDALGLPAGQAGEGTSLLARAASPGAVARDRALIETEDGGVAKGLVEGRWKYVRRYGPRGGEQLYDLVRDPGEKDDVAADQPQVVARLRAALAEELADAPPTYALRAENPGPEAWRVSGRVVARGSPPEVVELVGLEDAEAGAAADGPFERDSQTSDGVALHGARFSLFLPPGDRDELVFRPPASCEELELMLFADGEPLAPGELLLGDDGRAAESLPLRLSSSGASGLFSTGVFEPSNPSRAVRLWTLVEAQGEQGALPETDAALLRAVGYFGSEGGSAEPARD